MDVWGDLWPRRFCRLCNRVQAWRHGRCCGQNPDDLAGTWPSAAAGREAPETVQLNDAALFSPRTIAPAGSDPDLWHADSEPYALDYHGDDTAAGTSQVHARPGLWRALERCAEECWTCAEHDDPISLCCFPADIPHWDHICQDCWDLIEQGETLPAIAVPVPRAGNPSSLHTYQAPHRVREGGVNARDDSCADNRGHRHRTLLQQLIREAAMAASGAGIAGRLAIDTTTPAARAWITRWGATAWESPGFHEQGRTTPGGMSDYSGQAPRRTYLGRTLTASGTRPPQRPTGRPCPWVSAYVDDMLVWDGHRAWLLPTNDVLNAWASGHIALSELRSDRAWDAARAWAGRPAILPERNDVYTGAGAGDATAEDTDDVSACAAWGDPEDREELVLTYVQELFYIVYWGIREDERLGAEEVD